MVTYILVYNQIISTPCWPSRFFLNFDSQTTCQIKLKLSLEHLVIKKGQIQLHDDVMTSNMAAILNLFFNRCPELLVRTSYKFNIIVTR